MQTQIQCPNCTATIPVEIHQLVDAQQTPQLKERLLTGALNVAHCPTCGSNSQVASPLIYHDAEHELLMAYVPMELNIPMHEQEQMIGRMAKAITDSIPPEQFKGYLLQPQTIMTYQTFVEKVLETEGVTPEMLQRQRDQAALLQQLAESDRLTTASLIQEKADLIDETFFAILASNLQALEQNPSPAANAQFIKFTNIQAKLYTSTEIGKQLETEQAALRQFQQDVKEAGGLTFDIFIDALLDNSDNDRIQNNLIQMGRQGIRYELFSRITERMDTANGAEKDQLETLRTKLLKIYEELQAEAKSLIEEAAGTLDVLLHAQNLSAAIKQNLNRLDEGFMHYLSAEMQAAQNQNDTQRQEALVAVYNGIMQEAENQLPPEVRILNALVQTNDPSQQQALLAEIPQEARPEFKAMVTQMAGQIAAETAGDGPTPQRDRGNAIAVVSFTIRATVNEHCLPSSQPLGPFV